MKHFQEEFSRGYIDMAEEDIFSTGGDASTDKFDLIIGGIEEILLDCEFCAQVSAFMKKHCNSLSNGEENKHEDYQLFKTYEALVEDLLEKTLMKRLPWFNLQEFLQLAENRRDEIPHDIIDVLSAMTSFEGFKEAMLTYKQGSQTELDCFVVSPVALHPQQPTQ